MKAETVTPSDDFVQRISATRRGARLARLLAVQQLDAWGIPYGSEPSDVAAAVVAELTANAVTHGRVPGQDFELRLALTGRTLRIEVTDTRTEKGPDPTPVPLAADSESGRGLLLVQALAMRWGVRERTVGKTIWAAVPSVPDFDPPCGAETGPATVRKS
ncbi:hypothetical protein N566_14455 [Streptomycetaceae bacterium MP113-05]|nr:hypothetical protein N566_14455 [Streptomycetaceae bacterium MP113-05]